MVTRLSSEEAPSANWSISCSRSTAAKRTNSEESAAQRSTSSAVRSPDPAGEEGHHDVAPAAVETAEANARIRTSMCAIGGAKGA